MIPAAGTLVLLLPWAMRGASAWRLWALAAGLYPLGTALSVGAVLALPGPSLVVPLERLILASGLAALVAVALKVKRRGGPVAAFWMGHVGLTAALVAGGWTPPTEALRFVGTMGLLLGALGAALTVWRRS